MECIATTDGTLLTIIGIMGVMLFLFLLGFLMERSLRKGWEECCRQLETLLTRRR